MSIFEAGMLVCFGVSWPLAAYKTYKCKCVQGKSIYFSILILVGYACGIAHKLLYSRDLVIILYLLNTLFLLLDMALWFRYKNNPAPVPVKIPIREIPNVVESETPCYSTQNAE